MGKPSKTITIVTPSYNQGQFIEQTIKSVLSQAGNFYIDYIISDNTSTDQSLEIIKKYDQLLKNKLFPIKCLGINYHWWLRENQGQTYGINKSFEMAEGDILAWINSDDYYEPGTFDFITRQFQIHPKYDLLYGNCFVIYQETRRKKILQSEPGNFEKILRRNHSICQPAAFFTKKVFQQVGPIDDNLQYAFDYDLWLKILKVDQGLCLDKTLANFRIWENSKTYSNQEKFNLERKKIFKRHGGNLIDPKTIYAFRAKIKLLKTARNRLPKLYNLCKKILYFFLDKLRYRNKQ